MYLCISTVVDFNSQNFDPLMKFDKYSPGVNATGTLGGRRSSAEDARIEAP